MSKKIEFEILKCSNCGSDELKIGNGAVKCEKCNSFFLFQDNKYIFKSLNKSNIIDSLDRIKHFMKHYDKFYQLLIHFISPVLETRSVKKYVKKNVTGKNFVALNIGSGSSNISNEISNIDIFLYKSVDLACDIENIPIKDNVVDYIFNIAVLEHVPNPEKVVNEMHRILKKEGVIYVFFPFMQPFHASPYDFSRRTIEGMKDLFKDFEQIELKPFGGPTSGFLWVLQEWIAILFSFGSKKLHLIIFLLTTLLTFPLKFLDFLLVHHPLAKNISSGFIFIGKKKAASES